MIMDVSKEKCSRLFDESERTDFSPKSARESQYEYLKRSAQKPDGFIRQILEEWFEIYSANNPKEAEKLRGHLLSKKDDQHFSAFFELYLFTFFKNLGFNIEIERSVEGSSKKPDFLISDPKTGKQFYLEARTACEGNINNTREKAINLVIERINNKISSLNYTIELYWYGSCWEQDINKQIMKEIEEWIENPSHSYRKEFSNWGFKLEAVSVETSPDIIVSVYKLDKVQVLNEKKINKDSFTENRMDAVERIQKALIDKKASEYGNLEKPYLIALNMIGTYFSISGKIFLKEALFGRKINCQMTECGKHFLARAEDGFWSRISDNNPMVSGVFGFFNLVPKTMFECMHNLNLLPVFINNPVSSHVFDFQEIFDVFDTSGNNQYEFIANPEKIMSVLCLSKADWNKVQEEDGWGEPYEKKLEEMKVMAEQILNA